MPDPANNVATPSPDPNDIGLSAETTAAPPMSTTLLARLFVVPAVLVSLLVVGLVTVVVLFGWSSIGQRPATKDLIAAIRADTGDRQAGVLFPQSKEVWLAAKELAERLKHRDRELKAEEIGPIADQLKDIVRPLFQDTNLSEGQRLKAAFILTALGRLQSESAVDALVEGVAAGDAVLRQAALRGLADSCELPAARLALPAVIHALDDPATEVRLVACVVVSQLADVGDRKAIDALAERLDRDREMQWNAAVGLARLGSPRGKLVLLSMLERDYWKKNQVSYATPDGRRVERPFTPTEVEHYMAAAMKASAGLSDGELRAAIAKLKDDPSVDIREHAARVLALANP